MPIHNVEEPITKTHVDCWVQTPYKYEGERLAKIFLEHYRRPAIDVDYKWIAKNPIFCTYQDKRYRCVGASRFGDVWLNKDFKKENGYDKRVFVDDCSEWSNKI